ncbi:MAG: flagellar motor protein [Candidatus Fermentithermobacillus carboniphilus]|uniref:Flagellar motor protein n=1 Tax=Candidatus Fermentithermobacillus carboniphilus TaxID=3085328 RepID=A0AAT9LCT2_9FIRM|nr:MAG: flagellar motor protein [Candidatus Fermentithermobacillus carboniphilus]
MDRASVLGIVSGFGLVLWAMLMGGSLKLFWDVPSVLITVGGTLTATLMSYPMETFLDVLKIAKNAFFSKEPDLSETINTIVRFADKARREGLLALDQDADALEDPFLQKGVRLVVDGTTPELVRSILETELAFVAERHKVGQSMFETMGAFAPAFGMLGTLIGLIQMLVTLDQPEKIGPGMAVALVTTFYGSILANLVFLPIANKLKNRSAREVFIKEAIIEGVLSIQAGDNPRIVQEKLKSFLSPKERERVSMPSRVKGVPGSESPFDAK